MEIREIRTHLVGAAPEGSGGWDHRNWLFVEVLTDTGICPRVHVASDGAPLRYYDVKCFRAGKTLLAGIIRSPRFGPINPLDVNVVLDRPGVVYNVLAGTCLGKGTGGRCRLLPGEPGLVVSLPSEVRGVQVAGDTKVKRGEATKNLEGNVSRRGILRRIVNGQVHYGYQVAKIAGVEYACDQSTGKKCLVEGDRQ